YLEKIIQLQVSVPPVSESTREQYIRRTLHRIFQGGAVDASPINQDVIALLSVGSGGNPRQIKRLVGNFGFMHLLAQNVIAGYEPEVLALTLLIQQRSPRAFDLLCRQPDRFPEV